MTNESPFQSASSVGKYRSDGPILGRLLAEHQALDCELAFDPVQGGWVRADAVDDFHPSTGARPGWPRLAGTVALRAWTPEDADLFRGLLDDPAVWEHLPNPYPGPISRQMAADLIALSNDAGFHHVRAVTLDGVPVGQVRLEYSDAGTELSYWIGRQYWGRGIAGRAVRACLATAPVRGALHARVRPGNTASRRVLDRAGFRPASEGLRDGWLIVVRPD